MLNTANVFQFLMQKGTPGNADW